MSRIALTRWASSQSRWLDRLGPPRVERLAGEPQHLGSSPRRGSRRRQGRRPAGRSFWERRPWRSRPPLDAGSRSPARASAPVAAAAPARPARRWSRRPTCRRRCRPACSQRCTGRLGDPEVGGDLGLCQLPTAGHRDHVTLELGRVLFGMGHPSRESSPHDRCQPKLGQSRCGVSVSNVRWSGSVASHAAAGSAARWV